MANYLDVNRRGAHKLIALWLLSLRPLNAIAVRVLRFIPASDVRRRVPVIGAAGRLHTGSGQVTMLGTDRCQIAKELYWENGTLHSAAERLSLTIATSLSMKADVFLDIGAYTGLFALAVARENRHLIAHAYEIVPENFLLLWKNIIENDLVERVRPHLTGIGAEAGSITVPKTFGSGVLPSSVSLDSDNIDGVCIPVTTLDSDFAALNGQIIMKIDVEGFEWPVMQGAGGLISRTHPDIICEILVRSPNLPAIVAFLSAKGYNMFRITGEGLIQCDTIEPVKQERDWLFTKKTAEHLKDYGLLIRGQ